MKTTSLTDLLSEASASFAEKSAIEWNGGQLTYLELEKKASGLAHQLTLSNGVKQDSIVALMLTDPAALIVAIIAVLKTGAIFMPVDSSHPEKRLLAMFKEARPTHLLAEPACGALAERLASAHAPCHVCLVTEDGFTGRDFSPSSLIAARDEACYIYFTSGSTGRPKAILGSHKGLLHFVQWEIRTFKINDKFRISQLTPPTFDPYLRDILVPLCAGATVCLPESRNAMLDAPRLVEWLDQARINLVHCVPTIFRAIVNEPLSAGHFPNLKYILLAGEPLYPAEVRKWFQFFGERTQLVNLYGPTETTLAKFCYFIKPPDVNRMSIPVGKPIDGAQALIFDEQGNACPTGLAGEICIRTPYRSLGYYNRPDLTRDAFIHNPFSPNPNDIIYKTGDIGRVLPDGNFEVLGRKDNQVKIRGVRVELGEIEGLLHKHESVREAVVKDWEDVNKDKYLCAYIVSDIEIEAETFRDYLSNYLPPALIPSFFIRRDKLPRNLNGKIDRKALPDPRIRAGMSVEYVAPRNEIERRLVEICQSVLGVEKIGLRDNLFKLGAHSLMATKVFSRIRRELQVDIALGILFQTSSLEELAAKIEGRIAARSQCAPSPRLVAISRDQPLQLSFAQQRLWFLSQLEPDNPFYNIPAAVRLTGALNVAALERSLSEIVRRHEVLRTNFLNHDGLPHQVINDPQAVVLPIIDLSGQSENQQRAEVVNKVQEEARRPFDLERELLLRVTLLRLSEREFVLLLVMHHLISDGWSMGILIREAAALYQAYCAGQPPSLPEMPIQYVDFAHWQRNWLQGQVLEEQLAYWRKQMEGAPAQLALPVDNPRPALQTFAGAKVLRVLPAELSAELKSLAREEGATLFMTMLAAFQALLHRYTGQDDIVVGSPTANRTLSETENLIGLFVNTLVLRAKFEDDPDFKSLLKRVRENVLGAQGHQELPFEKLVKEVRPDRDLSYNPVFQVAFFFNNLSLSSLEVQDLTFRPLEIDNGTSKFDLTLDVDETPEGLFLSLEYNSDLFHAETGLRLLAHFQSLLEAVVANPRRRISEIGLLSEKEKQNALVDWNRTERQWPAYQSVIEMFEEQISKRSHSIAVESAGVQLSYGELETRANRIGNYLRRLGVNTEVKVGLCLPRGVEMVEWLLGILKAGGAYVPLDSRYPRERLKQMAEEAGLRLLVTNSETGPIWDDVAGVQVMQIDVDEEFKTENELRPPRNVQADNLAYVIFTSGSTGRPKGVQITHRSLINFLASMREQPGLGERDILLAVTSLSFDIAALEIFLPLIVGAKVIVVSQEESNDVGKLIAALEAHRPTVMQATPSLWRTLLEAGWKGDGRLKVLCGGEALGEELAARLNQTGAMVWNLYGPTETTIWSSLAKVERGDRRIVIGGPIANTEIYVLDSKLKPVPVGVIGEVYIGGAGLARGYLGQPALTATSFIPDPNSGQQGQRLYRTGDMGRYCCDGSIECLGRGDQQVKLRGHRIELGEIEFVLNRHPAIAASVVIDRSVPTGEKQLVAYVTAKPEAQLSVSELRSYVAKFLPEYMVPAMVVQLDEMPLTPNGKIDRQGLPAPTRRATSQQYRGARTTTEQMLCAIWAEVLGLEQVGIDDNFFDLGGDSITATQLVARIGKAFPADLSLRSLFEAPTIASLSAEIDQTRSSTLPPPLQPLSRDGELPLSFAQERLWFLDQLQTDSYAYNISTAIRVSSTLNESAFERAVNELVRRHEVLRTTFITVEGRPVINITQKLTLTLPVIDLRGLPEGERNAEALRVATLEARKRFELSQGPLFRVTRLRLGDEDYLVLLTMHHIISDGRSMNLFFNELATLYEAEASGVPATVPELPVQYADFAHWQRQWLQGEILEKHLTYWKHQLANAPARLRLPTDKPRPAIQSFRGAKHTFTISSELTRKLGSLSSSEGATLFMTLLAAFKTLLFRYAGQDDLVIGIPISNRIQAETENLIGVFVNTLVLRTQLAGDPSFRELLRRVREVVLDAHAYQSLPFEQLVDQLQLERNLSHHPLFQVMFVYQNAAGLNPSIAHLAEASISIDAGTSKFDLTLEIAESEDGLSVELEYDSDLFEQHTVVRMAEHFRLLLEGIVDHPQQRLSELPLLTETEQRFLRWEANDTKADYPQRQCLHDLIAAQAHMTPSNPAVISKTEQLSYQQLDQRANQLASYLRRKGVGPDVLVGVCLHRSTEMILAVLGVLKAGGAYVPLDPSLPKPRLTYMIDNACMRVLLTEQRLADHLKDQPVETIALDAEWSEIALESSQPQAHAANSDNLAYVMYTSGSTGRPKGVMITHGGLVNYLTWARSAYRVADSVGAPLYSSFSFDLTVTSLFLPLITGKSIRMIEEKEGIEGLVHSLATSRGPSLLKLTPAHLALLKESLNGWTADGAVGALIIGGEALYAESLNFWRNASPATRLINEYGPTETVVGCCVYEVPQGDEASGAVPIGRPIANTRIYILDPQLRLVPLGVVGEICIGGAGVARGYWRRPDLTAERFVPDEYSGEVGARLYRTGDRGKYLPDGNVLCLGREDQQVKVRGYRVELGEIEATLKEHQSISEAVVVFRADDAAERRLVAYVSKKGGEELNVTELRQYLKERLPEYMVPAMVVQLDEMPLAPNGKIDRESLPAPTRRATSGQYRGARTATEQMLCAIWAEVLGLEQVGIDDNFFDLGGDSILILQVIYKANQLGFHFNAQDVFRNQTIAQLASVKGVPLKEAQQGLVTGSLPLTPIQYWFFERSLAKPHHYNQAIMLELLQEPDDVLLKEVLRQVFIQHDALRLRFIREDTGWRQVLAEAEDVIPFTRFDLSHLPETEQWPRLAQLAAELQASLNISRGPLLRLARFDLGAERPGRLLLIVHHLAVDFVSWRILLEDFQQLYNQLSQNRSAKLEPKTASYKDWAERLVKYAQASQSGQELKYWLAVPRAVPSLPVDYPGGENSVTSAREITISLSVEETESILRDVPKVYQTQINDVLLTALVEACCAWSGGDSLLVDLEGHGRQPLFEDLDVTRTVGWFTSIYPVRLSVSGQGVERTLGQVKEVLRAVPSGGLGYGVLRYLSKDQEVIEQLKSLPQAEVAFNYLGQFDHLFQPDSRVRLARESSGPTHSSEGLRSHLLEIICSISEGRFHLICSYSENLHRRSTIETLVENYRQVLVQLINSLPWLRNSQPLISVPSEVRIKASAS